MMPFFPLISLLGISHLKTQILLCHFHTQSALLSHLQLGITAFPNRGPVFIHSFSILPTKCTKSSCHCVLNMLSLPNLPQLSLLLRHPPVPTSHTPKPSLVSPAPNVSLQCHTCPTVTGDSEHADSPSKKGWTPGSGDMSSATMYSVSGTQLVQISHCE